MEELNFDPWTAQPPGLRAKVRGRAGYVYKDLMGGHANVILVILVVKSI